MSAAPLMAAARVAAGVTSLTCQFRTFTTNRVQGRKRTRLRVECFEERLRLFEVGGTEALGEPAVDRRQQVPGEATAGPITGR